MSGYDVAQGVAADQRRRDLSALVAALGFPVYTTIKWETALALVAERSQMLCDIKRVVK